MNINYKGIKINNKIIIIAKHLTAQELEINSEAIPQGYVVDINNKNMLETAKYWAETVEYNKVTRTREVIPGDQFEYNNGTFRLTIASSANESRQGGKLSFWNCIIKTNDNKKFMIGINSELLFQLIKSNTLINGECQSNIWLGRVKGNQVGAFTENMEEFKQAKLDEETRKLKKVSTYKPGSVVESLTNKELYLGEMYTYGTYFSPKWDGKKYLIFYNKPKKVHAYLPIWTDRDTKQESYSNYIHFGLTKAARNVTDITDSKTVTKTHKLVDNFIEFLPALKCKPNSINDYYDGGYFSRWDANIFIKTTPYASRSDLITAALRAVEQSNNKFIVVTEDNLPEDCKEAWELYNKSKASHAIAEFVLDYKEYMRFKNL